ncbi:uncharacterized protein LOC101856808 isoform X2 [Aplysia californica]|uniref:Uncharacterized protein LOC101856808 isoform X2 n=1 Tax=Aplysia californica TaxID=6500 RepID=A0ABM1A1C3_APLCA|nr:uncharacterized protein LOC101856808 isoform X2 [Aplysia californica]
MVLECEKEWILEAINHLKHRKARPDLPHISLRMKRKHQMSFPQTKKLLDSLIECGFVVQAEYKNKISYRDVSKWKKGRLGGQIMNSSKMLKRFIKAIRENEASKGTGVSAQTIEEYLGSKVEQKCFLSGSALRDALDKEIETGFLYKRAVGDVTVYRINEDHRVMKNHGPDFEIEMPTKVKSRFTENKESVFPTPADSPSSEKSEAAVENSFKFETKKKRGRPKKGCSPTPKTERVEQDSEIFNDENSKQGTQSEQSSLYNEDEEDSRSLPAYAYPDIASWTPQQVAEYFAQKGYEAEAQKMLENELDGAALALLKRSDIVGPPLGGMLGIKTLGVALKLFRDIRDLLYQGNADNYMDPYEEKPFHRS